MTGVIILLMLVGQISGILDLLRNIASKTSINSGFLTILIKITGIAILTEFAVSICKDSGESAIASKVDIGGKVIIVALSMPIVQSLLETVIRVLP